MRCSSALRATEFPQLHDQSAKARKEFINDAHITLDAGARGFSPMRESVRMPLTIVMGMVLLVAGMAVVNVASLLLVRAATRAREFSVRFRAGRNQRTGRCGSWSPRECCWGWPEPRSGCCSPRRRSAC
jgi:hypothetical protein